MASLERLGADVLSNSIEISCADELVHSQFTIGTIDGVLFRGEKLMSVSESGSDLGHIT